MPYASRRRQRAARVAARAGGAGGRRKRAARAGGARGWCEVMVYRLRADGAALLGGRGWPPSVRCGFAMGLRSTPKGVPGIVGAGPKDLPASVEGSGEVRFHCWCPRARGPFSRQDVSKHEIEETDRGARRRHADVAAEDQGSDGRGCDDGAREASESGVPSRWRSQLGAAVVPITRTPRPFSPPPIKAGPLPNPNHPNPNRPKTPPL